MNYFEKVKLKNLEFDTVEKRMVEDSNLLYLKRYIMMDRSGKHAVPGVINATLNKPAVFFSNVIANLGAVKQQVAVESESAKVDTTMVESVINAVLDMANLRLRKMRYPLLNPFADVQFCARGRTGRRVLVRRDEDDSIISDIMPWDGRFIRHEIDEDGLVWASYATNRTKDQILAEYGIETKSQREIVLDVWDREHEEVWVGNKMVKSTPHDFGYTPVVITSVPLGYGDILLDDGHEKREGESIFYLIRDIVPQLNMMLTILQTLNFMSVKRPMNYVNKDGKLAEPPEYDQAISPGAVTSADLGGGLMPIEFGDATKAAQLAYSMLEKAIQEGGYTDIDIGNVQQPFSAVALMTIGEGKDQVLLPRLAAKEILNIDTAEMAIRQLRELGTSVELGVSGHTTKYPTSKLEGEYTVDFKYFTKNPKIDVARVNVAMQAAQFYPRSYLYKEVLQVEDPNGMTEDWYAQQAEQLDPNVLKHRIIQSLLKKAEEHDDEQAAIEAMIMSQGLAASMEQSRMGLLPGEQPKQPADKKGDMSLLPPSGSVESGVGMNPSQFAPMPVAAGTAGG
jgi:hypothetical protein